MKKSYSTLPVRPMKEITKIDPKYVQSKENSTDSKNEGVTPQAILKQKEIFQPKEILQSKNLIQIQEIIPIKDTISTTQNKQKRIELMSGDNDIPNETQELEESKIIDEFMRKKQAHNNNNEIFDESQHILQQSIHGLLMDCTMTKLNNKKLNSPGDALDLLPNNTYNGKIKGLKLSTQPLKSLKGLVPSLLIINISNCGIKNLSGINICQKLEFLNANRNQIQSLTPLVTLEKLTELHLAYNCLNDLKELPKIKKLAILDISGHHFIQCFEDLELLAACRKLKGLLIKDTGLTKQKNYEVVLKQMCQNLLYIDQSELIQKIFCAIFNIKILTIFLKNVSI